LVADENEMGGNMERIMKSLGQDVPDTKPILEINPNTYKKSPRLSGFFVLNIEIDHLISLFMRLTNSAGS
jgi:hypothetical protein